VVLRQKAAVFIDNVNIVRQVTSTVSRPAVKTGLVGCTITQRRLAADIFLNATARVSIGMYDIRGRLVQKAAAALHHAGYSRIVMDLGSISRGTYTVKVSYNNTVSVKKIVVDR
jgi:hypothetical protein